ncbi:unnamed protein product, partial [Linum tenue]
VDWVRAGFGFKPGDCLGGLGRVRPLSFLPKTVAAPLPSQIAISSHPYQNQSPVSSLARRTLLRGRRAYDSTPDSVPANSPFSSATRPRLRLLSRFQTSVTTPSPCSLAHASDSTPA